MIHGTGPGRSAPVLAGWRPAGWSTRWPECRFRGVDCAPRSAPALSNGMLQRRNLFGLAGSLEGIEQVLDNDPAKEGRENLPHDGHREDIAYLLRVVQRCHQVRSVRGYRERQQDEADVET